MSSTDLALCLDNTIILSHFHHLDNIENELDYPFIIKEIREYLGDRNIVLIDGSKGTSSQLKRKLEENDLMRDGNHCGAVTILNSSDDHKMIELSERLLQQNDQEVQND